MENDRQLSFLRFTNSLVSLRLADSAMLKADIDGASHWQEKDTSSGAMLELLILYRRTSIDSPSLEQDCFICGIYCVFIQSCHQDNSFLFIRKVVLRRYIAQYVCQTIL